jgi:hypothetical protein
MHPLIAKAFTLLPPDYRNTAYVAGGAAVNITTASDIDVFVLGLNDEEKIEAFEAQLRTFLAAKKVKFRTDKTFVKDPETIETDSAVDGHFNVVVDIPMKVIGLPVQLIASPFMTVEDLLRDFDLSVHCVAYNQGGILTVLPETTLLVEPIRLLHSNIPGLTRKRYTRLCERYMLPEDPDEVAKIEALMLEKDLTTEEFTDV